MTATAIEPHFLTELSAATTEVFRTMVFREVTACARSESAAALQPGANVVATVAFAGKTSGLVAVYTTFEAATEITAAMLGIEPGQVDGELPDAIGELANMIAGSFRTRMAAVQGETWAISIPTVTVGKDFYTKYVSDVQRVVCPFQMGSREVRVELIVTRRNGR
jgi:chemotaxis protein CheX